MLSCRLAQLSSCSPTGCLSSFLSACRTHHAVQSVHTVFGSGPIWLSACQSVAHCILYLHESSGRPCERPRGWESRRLIFVRTWQRADLNRADERQEGTDIKRLQDLSPTLWGQEQSHDGLRVQPLNWFSIPVNVFASSAQFVTHLTCWVSLWLAEICHDTTSKHPPPMTCALYFDPNSALDLHLRGWWRCHCGTSTLCTALWLTHTYILVCGHWLCVLEVFL